MKLLIILIIIAFIIIKYTKTTKTLYASKYYVIDGDTIAVYDKKRMFHKSYKVRLYGIDAPESDQEYGYESTKLLKKLLNGKPIKIKIFDKDKYGRYVGVLSTKKYKDINLLMVLNGAAIYYKKFAINNVTYENAEKQAKSKRLGIWKYDSFVEPEEFRKMKGNF